MVLNHPEADAPITPFASLSAPERLARLREFGMHGACSHSRVGPDAYELRPDTPLADACETLAQLLRSLIGSLELLAAAPDTSPSRRGALAGCTFLAQQAAGALAVVATGVQAGVTPPSPRP